MTVEEIHCSRGEFIAYQSKRCCSRREFVTNRLRTSRVEVGQDSRVAFFAVVRGGQDSRVAFFAVVRGVVGGPRHCSKRSAPPDGYQNTQITDVAEAVYTDSIAKRCRTELRCLLRSRICNRSPSRDCPCMSNTHHSIVSSYWRKLQSPHASTVNCRITSSQSCRTRAGPPAPVGVIPIVALGLSQHLSSMPCRAACAAP